MFSVIFFWTLEQSINLFPHSKYQTFFSLFKKFQIIRDFTIFNCLCFFLLYQKNSGSYVHCLQAAIMTPKGESWGYPYMKISPYRQATQPRKGCPHHRGLQPLPILTRGVGSFTSHKNKIGQSAVRQQGCK